MSTPPKLTDIQKAFLLDNQGQLNLLELTQGAFDDPHITAQDPRCRLVKLFLAGEVTPPAPLQKGEIPPSTYVLSEVEKERIKELVTKGRCESSLELARLALGMPDLSMFSHQWRAVYIYSKEIYPDSFSANENEPVVDKEWNPPEKLQGLCKLVNWAVPTAETNTSSYKWGQLKGSQERGLKSLMRYVRVMRFKYVASSYDRQMDRDLFISTFIRWAHDKPDLTEMEVDQMISAAEETVNIAIISRSIGKTEKYHESIMSGEEVDDSGKKKRFGMTEVEQINAIRMRCDQAKGRLKTLMGDLEETRSKRLTDVKDRNSSILNLFDEWHKSEETRHAIIAMGEREKTEDKAEAKRVMGLEDMTALISGMTEEELGS